ncbi:MAG: carbamoyltransferase N-terminal domain-containing protein [Planctomycetota bacterium]
MAWILGISSHYHDSAVTLLHNGTVVAAASEERFSRVQNDSAFPHRALDWALASAGIDGADIDHVGFYELPRLKWDRILETHLATAPWGLRRFCAAMPSWLNTKLRTRRELRTALATRTMSPRQCKASLHFTSHHLSHAASAFYPSPFERAAVLTMDGVGEWSTTTWGVGQGREIQLHQEIRFPHSLGLLYSTFTDHLGFEVNSGEYKMMGLAAYGQPRWQEQIEKELIRINDDGSFALNLRYFQFQYGFRMGSPKLARWLGLPRRSPDDPIESCHRDLACSIQRALETTVLTIARHIHRQTGLDQLCLAGGVALNGVCNSRLLREGPFESIWVQPAAGDAGGSLGVAMWIWHEALKQPREVHNAPMWSTYLGPTINTDGLEITHLPSMNRLPTGELARQVAELVADGRIVAIARGPMEFGPRALGNRSILADPRDPEMKDRINRVIKQRESFRPFAPVVMQERASEIFDMGDVHASPFMQMTFTVAPEWRPRLPAITHVDHSARLQTVNGQQHRLLHEVLQQFDAITGCPVLLNTSLNIRGEPIACTAEEAYAVFMNQHIDALVLNDCLLLREDQP